MLDIEVQVVVSGILMVEIIIVGTLSIGNSIAKSCGVASINFSSIVLICCGIFFSYSLRHIVTKKKEIGNLATKEEGYSISKIDT